MTGHEISVVVGQKDPLDFQVFLFRQIKIGGDIPARIHHQRLAAADEHIGIVGQHPEVELHQAVARILVSIDYLVGGSFVRMGCRFRILDGRTRGAVPDGRQDTD